MGTLIAVPTIIGLMIVYLIQQDKEHYHHSYVSCDRCSYDILDDEGELMEHECNYYCENCFEEELEEYVEQYDGTILCYGCDSKRLIREQ